MPRPLKFAFLAIASAAASAGSMAFELKTQSYAPPTETRVVSTPEVKTPPVLDGKLDDETWKSAAIIDRLTTTGGGAADVQTKVYVAFDAKNIYVAFDCEEPEMDRVSVRAEEGQDLWPGDCVEVFLDINRSRKNYYQFVTNSKGAHNDYVNGGAGNWWDGKWQTKSGRTQKGWCAELAIPWTDLAIQDPQREKIWGFNVTRERTLMAKGDSPSSMTLLTWAPMQSFGSPDLFGTLFFGANERLANQAQDIGLAGTLDKQLYTKNDRIAHLALGMESGEPKGGTLAVQIDRIIGAQMTNKATAPMTGARMGLDVPIADLEPGQYTLRVQATDSRGKPSNALAFPLNITKAPPVAQSGEIKLRRTQTAAADLDRWHVRAGVPFPEGALWDCDHVAVFTADGKPVPAQIRTLATWSKGGTVKWMGVDLQLPLSAKQQEELTLRYGPDVKTNPGGNVRVTETDKTITIDTGAARFELKRTGFNFIEQMWIGEKQVIAGGQKNRGPFMADEQGKTFWGSLDPSSTVTVTEQNPLHAAIRAEGFHADEQGRKLGRYVMHMHFYSGLPYFRVQHTFVITEDTDKTRYSDIGLMLPVAGSECRFGVSQAHPSPSPLPQGAQGERKEKEATTGTTTVSSPLGGEDKGEGYFVRLQDKSSISLLQRRWDDFIVKENAAEAKQLTKGYKAAGWFARGDLAVIVRDFWQNFPKELEATPQSLTVHFWPKHGERVWTEEKEVLPEEAYMLPFVHQGKVLDFKMPERYFTGPLSKEYGFAYPDGKGGWKLHYGAEAKKTNAMGLGKTHDMLIAFGDAAQPQRVAALREAFQQDVHFLPNPNWTCETKVVGEMPPVDKERFPYQEAYISGGFDFLMRWTWDATHAYGMFNYGDSYHVIADNQTLRPSYYRLWAGYHHGRARVPWLFYLRSGDPRYFQWARANTQHLMDVDTCHFSTPEFESANETARKLVGGLCDYKGIVHWSTGARVSDYNNMLDFLLLDYYLTGNERAQDVAHEIGQLLIQFAQGSTSREACNLGALLLYYQHTWNANALLKFTTELPKAYAAPAFKHDPPSIQWGPYIEPWIAYSNDEQAKKFLFELTDTLLDPEKTAAGNHCYGDGRALAMAYELTKKEEYLHHAWGYYNRGPALFHDPKDPLHHAVDWLNYSFEIQQCLPVMAHLRRLPQRPTLAQPHYGGRGSVQMWHGSPSAEIRALLTEVKDGDFWVGAGRFFTRKESQYELISPKGRVVQSGIIPASNVGAERFKLIQMKDGETGDYALRVFGPDEFQFETTHISSLGTQRFILPKAGGKDEFILGGRLFFFVPAECQKFRLTVGPPEALKDQARAKVDILTPEDRVIASHSLLKDVGPRVIDIEPDPAFRGKVWSIAAVGCRIIEAQGIPEWFASHHAGAQLKKEDSVAAAR